MRDLLLLACVSGWLVTGIASAHAQAAKTCTEQRGRCVAICTGMQGSDPANCRNICDAGHKTCMNTGSFAAGGYRPITGLEKR